MWTHPSPIARMQKIIVGLKSLKSHISEWLIQLFDLLQVTSLTRRFLSYFSMKEWHWHVNFKIFIFHYDNFYIYKKYCKQDCIWQLQTNFFCFAWFLNYHICNKILLLEVQKTLQKQKLDYRKVLTLDTSMKQCNRKVRLFLAIGKNLRHLQVHSVTLH